MKKYQITISELASTEEIVNLLFYNAEQFSFDKRYGIITYSSASDTVIRNVNEMIKKIYDPKAKIRKLS